MPGLFGYWTSTYAPVSRDLMENMASSMRHQTGLKVEMEVCSGLGGGRVHLGLLQSTPQPCIDTASRYRLWLDGEFSNMDELVKSHDLNHEGSLSQAHLALDLYCQGGWNFLSEVDGLFTIALFDLSTRQLTLVSDRYGLRPLYWRHIPHGLIYAGEVKALLKLPSTENKLDVLAVDEWFSFGYLLGNRTWIEGVEQFPAGTIMQISSAGITQTRYWSWQDIAPLPTSIAESDIVEELGRLWIDAVGRRADKRNLGISLSGGLDSRSVLAAMPKQIQSLHAITFGQAGSVDCLIAARAAQIPKVPLHFFEITAGNFLEQRVDAVWRTDGTFDLLHMHGVEALPLYKTLIEIELQSLAGDLILGGSFLEPVFIEHWKQAFPAVFKKMYNSSPFIKEDRAKQLLMREFLKYSALPHSDFLFLDNRQRNFTYRGAIATQSFIELRLPSFDKRLVEFVYGLDDHWRFGGRIYHRMLLKRFPLYYKDIPWQKTGFPIGASIWRYKLRDAESFIERAVRFAGRKVGVSLPPSRKGYTDYPTWLRAEPARSFATHLLLSDDALYTAYVDRNMARAVVHDFLGTNNNHFLTTLGLLLTFEIYLRQLFNKSGDILGEEFACCT